MFSLFSYSLLTIGLSTSALAAPLVTGVDLPHSVTATAGGAPPNSGFPLTLSTTGTQAFQLANFLENLESAFFQAGLANLTTWGTEGLPDDTQNVVARVAAQEEVHVATIETLLNHFGQATFQPCQYSFPVSNREEFLALANTITNVGIGAVNDVASTLAVTDPAVIQSVTSIITVESRHDAFFRGTAGEASNPAPFDTRLSGVFAFNLALPFIVPGSCGSMPQVPILPGLSVSGGTFPAFAPSQRPTTLTFAFDASQVNVGGTLYIGWVNQVNNVKYTPATVLADGTVRTDVPADLNGFAFAALTNQNTALTVGDLAGQTLAGPAPVPVS